MRGKFSSDQSRRTFINKMAKGVLAYSFVPNIISTKATGEKDIAFLKRNEKYSANDQIQIGLIGAGGMGNADADTAGNVPGGKIVAACDLYDGRLDTAKKKYGNDIFITKDYREILSRKDIDAVIVATPDH